MQKRAWMVGIGVGLIMVACIFLARHRTSRGGAVDLAAWTPRDAVAVMWLDDLGALLADLDELGTRLEGAAGIPEALALSLGVERPTPAAFDQAGLVVSSGAVAFVWHGAAWACVALHPSRGIPHVRTWLGQRGFDLLEEPAPGTWLIRRPNATSPAALVWLRGSTLLVRAALPATWAAALGGESRPPVATGKAVAAPVLARSALLAELEAAEKGLPLAGDGGVHLNARLGKNDALRPLLRRGLGLASLLFGGLIDGIQGLRADLRLRGRAVRLAFRLLSTPKANTDIARYHDGFLAKDSVALDLGDVLPDEIALWARVHINPRQLDMIPSFLRNRLLPATLLAALHPALAQVDARALFIDRLEGRLAAGVLGIDDKASLDPRSWIRTGLQRVLSGFVAGTLGKEADAVALSGAVRAALSGAGEQLTPLTLGRWQGWSGAMLGTEVALLRRGNALLLIAGRGERARFERVARGRFPSLGKVAVRSMEKAMAADAIGWVGLGSTTGRIVRAARRRGVPDAFVRMVRGVAAVTMAVQLDADGVGAAVELRPRAEAKP